MSDLHIVADADAGVIELEPGANPVSLSPKEAADVGSLLSKLAVLVADAEERRHE